MFFHPRWLDTEPKLRHMSKAEKTCLETQLHQFLDIGHLEKIQPRLKKWMDNLNITVRDEIMEPRHIRNWPDFIMTLYALIQTL